MNKSSRDGLLFTGPHFALFLLFVAVPTLFTVVISFFQWDLYSDMVFVGLDNYKTILFNVDSVYFDNFWNGLRNTMIFTVVAVPIGILIPLGFAAILNEEPPMRKFLQAAIYFPSILSVATVVVIWGWLFRQDVGLINNFFGLNIPWASQVPWTWIALQIMTIWFTVGGNMIIYLAGMSNISEELYESASIDGANKIQQFFKITIPQLRTQIKTTLMFTVIGAFNIFAQPWMFNNGGPGESNYTLVMYIRSLVFGTAKSQAGIACAMAVVLGIIIIVAWNVMNKIIKDKNE